MAAAWIEWAIALAGLLAVLHVIGSALLIGIGPSPSSPGATDKVLALLPRDAKQIHELGAGFGGVTIAIAKARPTATVIAWELSWLPFLVTRFRTRALRNVRVRRASFLDADLSQADAVFAYLFRAIMPVLQAKLRTELRSGAAVISHTFMFRDWPPARKLVAEDSQLTPVWLWLVNHSDQP